MNCIDWDFSVYSVGFEYDAFSNIYKKEGDRTPAYRIFVRKINKNIEVALNEISELPIEDTE